MDFNDNKPIYLQITDGIMDSIVSGEFEPGERIPSVREYAMKVEVNPNTVMRSYEWLQQRNIIANKRGIGFSVLPDAREKIVEMRRDIFFQEEAEYFFNRLKIFGMTPEQLADLYCRFLNQR